MKFNYPYLKDMKFLRVMDLLPQKELFIKITALEFLTERPIAEIQGRVTGGSINLDGKSIVRRTANVNMVADDQNYNITNVNNIISINKKIAIEIGVTNSTIQYRDYPIVWYPQGIYVVNNATITHNNQGLNIAVSAKDKMCLLNGDCGGTLEAATEFDGYDIEQADGSEQTRVKYPIYQMIARIVHELGGEPWERIIINDIENRIKRPFKWTGADVPLYLYGTTNIDDPQTYVNRQYLLAAPSDTDSTTKLIETYSYGDEIGYVYSDFFYPTTLEEQAGAALTSALDKIKNTLGNFEYFYDIEGNFVFQEIKNYLNTALDITNLDYRLDTTGKAAYDLSDQQLISSFSNNPQFNLIKNNFVIWGTRTTSAGQKLPIRYHLALDQKPGLREHTEFYIDRTQSVPEGLPYLKKIRPILDAGQAGIEGEVYKTDDGYAIWKDGISVSVSTNIIQSISSNDFRTELYLSGLEEEQLGLEPNPYFAELKNEWPKLYEVTLDDEGVGSATLNVDKYDELDYFLDFIDSGNAYETFGIPVVGRRTKVLNEKEVDCIFRKDPLDIILIETGQANTGDLREEAIAKDLAWAQIPSNIFNSCSFSESGYSAFEAIRLSLHEYIDYNRSITVVTLPIYHLEPNTRIKVEDAKSGITGDFMVKSFSIPLDVNGTSSLTCTQAMDRL